MIKDLFKNFRQHLPIFSKQIVVRIITFTIGYILGVNFGPNSAEGVELDDATSTVQLNSNKTVTLTPEQVKRGKRLFLSSCSICHTGGITKTNPNVGLDTEALSLATPARNTIEGLVDYMKNPTTFDGLESIAEIHPSIRSADIFPRMRTLTEDDLFAIAGHILVQPKILAEKWGGGKIYY
jgi:photosystem II cytochrome c550|tara:strand:- start:17092 stop:17634 length:543 start_codon:yes stop_codon:yes gene_type:complete